MKSLEKIKQEHRERILKHICLIAFQCEPSSDEVNKLSVMMDLGKTIPEILASLRRTCEDFKSISFDVNLEPAVINTAISVNENDRSSSRTPLEEHFHRYSI